MNRRSFLKYGSALSFAVYSGRAGLFSMLQENFEGAKEIDDSNLSFFNGIIEKAKQNSLFKLNTVAILSRIAEDFLDTPYKGGTLEGMGREICRVDFSGLDCVTLLENSIALTRIIKKSLYRYEDFIRELTFIRYHNGELKGYESRLHYTSDWLADNEKKHVLKNLTKELGGKEWNVKVGFMSQNPQYYPALKGNKKLIAKIATIENKINAANHFIIKKDKLESIESMIQNADIIAFNTNKKGLDFSHVGFAYKPENEPCRLLHASSKAGKIVISKPLNEYIDGISSDIGINLARITEV